MSLETTAEPEVAVATEEAVTTAVTEAVVDSHDVSLATGVAESALDDSDTKMDDDTEGEERSSSSSSPDGEDGEDGEDREEAEEAETDTKSNTFYHIYNPISSNNKTLQEWLQLVNDGNTQDTSEFIANQRLRMAFRRILGLWRWRRWIRDPVCNVDLIENTPVKDTDAILFADTSIGKIYRFHRRDIFNTMLTNLAQADEMLPMPRPPTNPWTNEPLTYTQLIGVCKQLIRDYGRRGICPPLLFAGFCAARFDLRRFEEENSSILAQIAIRNCFKELVPTNADVVYESMTQLLGEANVNYSPVAVRRWLRSPPPAAAVKPWLDIIRDYYLYVNLHLQTRPTWHNLSIIRGDVRALWSATRVPEATSSRIRFLRSAIEPSHSMNESLLALLLPSLTDFSTASTGTTATAGTTGGDVMETTLALQLIQQALFRM